MKALALIALALALEAGFLLQAALPGLAPAPVQMARAAWPDAGPVAVAPCMTGDGAR